MAGNRRRRELRQRLNDTAVAFGEAMRSSDEEEIEEEGKEEEEDVIQTYLRRKEKCDALGLDVAQVFPNSLRSGLAAQQPAESSDDEDADEVTQPTQQTP